MRSSRAKHLLCSPFSTTINGTYSVNGHNCYHTKVNGALAIAWRLASEPGDGDYVIVEALMQHNGHGNDYMVL